MANVCPVTGKRHATGNTRSHSKRSEKRKFSVNLQKQTFVDPETGEKFTVRLSAKGIKTVTKNPRKLLELARKLRSS